MRYWSSTRRACSRPGRSHGCSDAVEQVGGKLVLVGDHRQLPELEAGGAFRGLVRRGLAVELTENCRQNEAWERQALDQLRAGKPEAAHAAVRRARARPRGRHPGAGTPNGSHRTGTARRRIRTS